MRKIEEPVTTPTTGAHYDSVTTHPAFAEISLTRRSGSKHLYGSDFNHQNYIGLRIQHSELHRGLSEDRYFSHRTPIIEIALSEAQFARMVSSMGMQGTPCTLESVNGESVPGIPPPNRRTEQFGREADERVQAALDSIKAVTASIEANTKLSKAEKAKLIGQLNTAHSNVGSNRAFVADQFGEYMEGVVQSARMEINAAAQQTARELGLPHGAAVLSLPASETEGKEPSVRLGPVG